jgi:predicted permease
MTVIIIQQLILMFIYMGIGYVLKKGKLISAEGTKSISNLLLYVILPATILYSFASNTDSGEILPVFYSVILGAVLLLLSMFLSRLFFPDNAVLNFSAAFSNAGFIGIPLISEVLGTEAVIYAAGMIAVLNVLQWTYGQWLLSGSRKAVSAGAIVKNPLLIAFVLGLVIFAARIHLPAIVLKALSGLNGMNAPIAMIILGIYLSEINAREIFSDAQGWKCSLVRLLVIPVASAVVLRILCPDETLIGSSLMLAASAPVGANVAVYAKKLNKDYAQSVRVICLSTVLSIAAIPAVYMVFELIFSL